MRGATGFPLRVWVTRLKRGVHEMDDRFSLSSMKNSAQAPSRHFPGCSRFFHFRGHSPYPGLPRQTARTRNRVGENTDPGLGALEPIQALNLAVAGWEVSCGG